MRILVLCLFLSDLVGNPEDRISHDVAHIYIFNLFLVTFINFPSF